MNLDLNRHFFQLESHLLSPGFCAHYLTPLELRTRAVVLQQKGPMLRFFHGMIPRCVSFMMTSLSNISMQYNYFQISFCLEPLCNLFDNGNASVLSPLATNSQMEPFHSGIFGKRFLDNVDSLFDQFVRFVVSKHLVADLLVQARGTA